MSNLKHKEISNEEAESIINSKKPLGLFWTKEKEYYVAIDNLTGDAWTEDFRTKEECFAYLDESQSTPCQTWTEC
ncbi:hypothetical protein FDG50_05275 [Clostridium botulinum]|uniref:hypothetical protein n=1 Tax=Clostridium botulinum TaxID=1491 RepID=UPI0007731E9F|nr:hypothetical protein [Clostridium botulinum]MBY6836934.1 hypothetical protein [Clostridium botulinum]NFG59769.1 hypothetical protein [Clostridium botulinum]NFG64897.1 hypothetical protein [Clostridium botulinum]NFN09368.1 hypothetical protein [Clostridium botulinum]NFN32952.1 hypothetical protein [Clostridium botulinum]